jgi:hypothetical protein
LADNARNIAISNEDKMYKIIKGMLENVFTYDSDLFEEAMNNVQ